MKAAEDAPLAVVARRPLVVGGRVRWPRPMEWDRLPGPAPGTANASGASRVEPAAAERVEAADPPAPSIVVERVIADARRQAEAIVAAAMAEAGAARAAAHRAGWRAGRARARARYGRLLEAARRTAVRARADRQALLEGLSPEVADLAMTIARRVLGRELEAVPDEVVALARRLVRRIDGPAVLRVHPDDAPLLEAEPLPPGVVLRPDPGLAVGGLRLETEDGVLDATIQGRLGRVAESLTGGAADGA